MLFRQLCTAIAEGDAVQYFYLLEEAEVIEVYELYSIKAAKGFVLQQKYK